MVKFFRRAPDLSNKVCMLYYTTLLRPCGQLAWRILEKQCCRQCWIRRNGEKGSQMQRPKILTFNMESHEKTVTSWQTRNIKKQWRNNMRLQMRLMRLMRLRSVRSNTHRDIAVHNTPLLWGSASTAALGVGCNQHLAKAKSTVETNLEHENYMEHLNILFVFIRYS